MNPSSDIYQGLHVLLVTEDEARGKALAKVLRDHKARVGDFKTSRDPAALPGVDVLLVDTRSSSGQTRTQEVRNDVRARWASVVNVDLSSLVKGDGSVLLGPLSELVGPVIAADRALTERARTETQFTAQLSPLGPSRTLRALSLSGHTLLVELRHPTLSATVEVANELLVSASAARSEKRWEAWSALVRILGLSDAQVMVARRSFTAAMNIMEPVDQALEVAAQERACSSGQIAAEEAEAERLLGKQELPQAVDPRGSARGPGYTPPRPPVRPSAAAIAPVAAGRTLMGMPVFASSAPATPSLAAPTMPAPRHAPLLSPQRPNATLLGVAPGAIPGLAEARAAAAVEARREQAELAIARAGEVNIDEMVTAPPPARTPASGVALQHDERELPDFDAPTGRLAAEDDLLDSLDELALDAAPLSQPLPPPRTSLPVNDNDVPLDEPIEAVTPTAIDRTEPEARDGESAVDLTAAIATVRASEPSANTLSEVADASDDLDDKDDLLPDQQTAVAPVPPELLEAATIPAPSAKAKPVTPVVPAPESNPPSEETLVVARTPAKPAPKRRPWLGLALLAGLCAVAVPLAIRANKKSDAAADERALRAEPEPAAKPASVTIAPSQAPSAPEHTAVEPARAPEPTAAVVPAAAVEPTPAAAPAAPEPAAAAPQAELPIAASADAGELVKQGQRLLIERKPAEARAVFEQALTQDAINPHVRAGLAESLLKLNEPQSALPQAQSAVKLRPKRARYQVLLGDVLAALGKLDDARAAWEKALALDANDAEAKARLR